MRGRRAHSQSGAVLVLFLLVLGVVISLLALVIDLGRLEALARSIQQSADASAVAAASILTVTDVDAAGENSEARRYADSKKLVLMIISQGELMGLDTLARASLVAQTLRFNSLLGVQTGPDWPDYQYDTAEAGNLKIRVRRQLHCFGGTDSLPLRQNYELDNAPNQAFCRANQVTVDITVSNVRTYFGKFLGMAEFSSVTRSATSFMHERIPNDSSAVCESTTCSALGINFGDLRASANCRGAVTP